MIKRFFFILGTIVVVIVATEITLSFTLKREKYPKSSSKIVSLLEKKKHKRGSLTYRLYHQTPFVLPNFLFRSLREKKLQEIKNYNRDEIFDRVNYYCKSNSSKIDEKNSLTIDEFYQKEKSRDAWWYVFDLYKYFRYFPKDCKLAYLFGDITFVPETKTIVKSRPINEPNENSVLLNLNQGRHFIFVNDKKKFANKKNLLVWRGAAFQKNRTDFINLYKDHPLCDVFDTSDKKKSSLKNQGYMSIDEQLDFKFILSLEGSDVATNLKWILSSNSLCFAPKHKYETWFMEAKLIPNHHYVLIQDDFSDLIEKINYYSEHTDEALAIISHANQYVEQFRDKKKEGLISLLVLKKYFEAK